MNKYLNDELERIKSDIGKRLNSRALNETYRTAVRLRNQEYNDKIIEDLSKRLRINLLSLLLRNGYKPESPEGFLEILTREFDFGNEIGIAVSAKVIKEENPVPQKFMVLLELIRKNKLLIDEAKELRWKINIMHPQWLRKMLDWIRPPLVALEYDD